MSNYPILENWGIAQDNIDPYLPPECSYPVLVGEVYGHPSTELEGIRVTIQPSIKNSILLWRNMEVHF